MTGDMQHRGFLGDQVDTKDRRRQRRKEGCKEDKNAPTSETERGTAHGQIRSASTAANSRIKEGYDERGQAGGYHVANVFPVCLQA